jgi:two-component system cell cycle response regulator DivK
MDRPIILIVDADLDSRAIFRTALEWRGYSVLATGEGLEALELAKRHAPELIIGDFPLPSDGARQPLTEARLRGEMPHTRPQILTVTARLFGEERPVQREAADAVLLKPIEPMRILEEVESRLGMPPVH